MIWKLWQKRLGYTALSVFVIWHTIAMMLAPVPPNNPIVRLFRSIYQPYLTPLGLDTTWDFFSPIGFGNQFSYKIEDSEGKLHSFMPIFEINKLLPDRLWYEQINSTLMANPEVYGEYFARFYCRKHASLKPTYITLYENFEERYRPQDHVAGRRPDDPAHLTLNPLFAAHCPPQ